MEREAFRSPSGTRNAGACPWHPSPEPPRLWSHVCLVQELVTEVAESLKELHRALLDAVRDEYERTRSPIGGAAALYQLVVEDPFFAWLRPMSQLMADVDELLDGGRIPIPEEAKVAARSVQRLISPPEGSDGQFWSRYSPLLQDVRVVVAHARLKQALRRVV
jgi:hypothetical protein